MPAEHSAYLIVEQICSRLATVVAGTTYHNTLRERNVSKTLRSFDELAKADMPLVQVLVNRLPGGPLVAQRRDEGDLEISLVCWTQGSEPEYMQRDILRLARDVIVCLLADCTLGATCRVIRVTEIVTDEGSLAYEGYAMAEISMTANYAWSWSAP